MTTDFAMFAPGEGFWSAPKLFQDRDVVIIGGGPSLREFNFQRLRSFATIGCNSAFLLGHEICKVALFSDKGFFQQVIGGRPVFELLRAYPGHVVTTLLSLHTHKWLHVMRRGDDRKGLSSDPTTLTFSGCSGGSAINLALHMGAKRVFLIGFDCKTQSKKQPNWHDNHRMEPRSDLYDKFIAGFNRISATLPATFPNAQVINLGPDSELHCFPTMPLDSIIP